MEAYNKAVEKYYVTLQVCEGSASGEGPITKAYDAMASKWQDLSLEERKATSLPRKASATDDGHQGQTGLGQVSSGVECILQ